MQKHILLAMAVALSIAISGVMILESSDADEIQAEEGMVAYSNTTGMQYPTLGAAINATADGGIVTILADIPSCSTVLINYEGMKTVNLNKHNITFAQNSCFYMFTGGLTVTGEGTVSETDGIARNGAFVIKLQSDVQPDDETVHLVIGSKVTAKGYSPIFIDINDVKATYGIVVDVYGTLVSMDLIDTTLSGPAIYLNGTNDATDGNTGVINIHEGASLTSEDTLGIYAAGFADWNVYGGTITGNTAMEIRAGSLNIEGGTFISTADEYTTDSNTNGSTVTGAALAISPYRGADQGGTITVNISGGTFTGPVAFSQANPNDVTEPDYVLSISGGNFDSTGTDDSGTAYPDVMFEADEISEPFITGGTFSGSVQDGSMDPAYSMVDGTVSPDPTKYIASVNGRYFSTLQAAFDYIESDDTPAGDYTVMFESDISESITITQKAGKNVTVEGNGHIMSGEITLDGERRHTGTEKLTIQNISFETPTNPSIDANEATYVHNLTIAGCDFAPDESTAAMYLRQCYNVTINDCTVKGGHSMAQMYGVNGLDIRNVTIDSEKGIALGTSKYVTISNVNITAEDYGIRGDFSTNNSVVSITDSFIQAEKPVVIRNIVDNSTNTYSLTVTGCTLDPTGEFKAITLTTGDDGAVIVPPTGTNVTVTTDEGSQTVAKTSDGTEHMSFAAALYYAQQNYLTGITLLDNVDLSTIGVIDVSGLTIDLGDKTITGTKLSPVFQGTGFTITNGTVDGSRADYGLWIGDEGTTTDVIIDGVTVLGGVNIYNATNVVLRNMDVTGVCYYAVWCDQGGQVTIESGTYTSASSSTTALLALSTVDSVMTINGGSFEAATGKVLVLGGDHGVPVINDGSFNVDPSDYLGDGVASFDDGQGGFSVDPGFVVTFMIDSIPYEVSVRPGETVDTSSLPTDAIPAGFYYGWTDAEGNSVDLGTIDSEATLYSALALDAPIIVSGPTVSGEIPDGGSVTISISATATAEGAIISYAITGMYADLPTEWSDSNVFNVTEAGTYVVWILATCTYDGMTYASVANAIVDVTAEGNVIPPTWDDDDDYVPIVPVVPDQSSGDDNTVTIVACAAAAVVAALMAVFLIIERRK